MLLDAVVGVGWKFVSDLHRSVGLHVLKWERTVQSKLRGNRIEPNQNIPATQHVMYSEAQPLGDLGAGDKSRG